MKYFLLITLVLSPFCYTATSTSNTSIQGYCLECRRAGFFSLFGSVVGFLSDMEKKKAENIAVSFGKAGMYYDPAHGDNWWEYYFSPIRLMTPSNPHVNWNAIPPQVNGNYSIYAFGSLSLGDARRIVKKYIHIRPEIAHQFSKMAKQFFPKNSHVIGVHYRGTDKISESRRVSYEEMLSAVAQEVAIARQRTNKVVVFVATDEQEFLSHIKAKYPNETVALHIHRSHAGGAPLHRKASADRGKFSGYESGLSALLDCLLLSKSHVLIRTASNLSAASLWFRNDMPKIVCISKTSWEQQL